MMKTTKNTLPQSILAVACISSSLTLAETNTPAHPIIEAIQITPSTAPTTPSVKRMEDGRIQLVAPAKPTGDKATVIEFRKDLDAAYATRIRQLQAELAALREQMLRTQASQKPQTRSVRPSVEKLEQRAGLTEKRMKELQSAYDGAVKDYAIRYADLLKHHKHTGGKSKPSKKVVPSDYYSWSRTLSSDDHKSWDQIKAYQVEPDYFIGVSTGVSKNGGVLVSGVMEGTPASKAGVKAKDIILSCNNIKLKNAKAMISIIQAAGDEQALTFSLTTDEARKGNLPPRTVQIKPVKRSSATQWTWSKPQTSSPPVAKPQTRTYYLNQPKDKPTADLRARLHALEKHLAEVQKKAPQAKPQREATQQKRYQHELNQNKKELNEVKKQLKRQQELLEQLMKAIQQSKE